MRVIITGSRDWRNSELIDLALSQLPKDSIIVHGCATGADAIARSLALSLGLKVEDHWPDYVNYDFAAANKRRNQEMVNAGADLVLAFPTPSSRGTWDCVRRAKNAGIPVRVIQVDGKEYPWD